MNSQEVKVVTHSLQNKNHETIVHAFFSDRCIRLPECLKELLAYNNLIIYCFVQHQHYFFCLEVAQLQVSFDHSEFYTTIWLTALSDLIARVLREA